MKDKLEQIFDKHHEGFSVYNKDEIIKELLVLYNVVWRGKQLCGCKEPKSEGWYADVYMCKCGKIYIELE